MYKLSLDLFNAVLVNVKEDNTNLLVEKTVPHGFILQPEVAQLPNVDEIIQYCVFNRLSGEQMNQTFHKSWGKIQDSSRQELLAHQLLHYITTYGFEKVGLYSDNTVYIPNEVLNVPEVDNLPLTVIKGLTREELINKCLDLLESGIALKEETIDKVLELLDGLDYTFTQVDNIKNKEAKLKISIKYDILPINNTEFMRLLIYKAINKTLIINDPATLALIQASGIDITSLCESYGLERLSQSFLRYKKLFLAFKRGNSINSRVVNRLRKLAKKNHKPMPLDLLNNITSIDNLLLDDLVEELGKVNNFRKIRLLYALHDRLQDTTSLLYKIRNGKTYVKSTSGDGKASDKMELMTRYQVVYKSLVKSLNLEGVKVRYPKGVEYVLPTTEKQFVGNIPSGSYMDLEKDVIVGIYWEDAWGAWDLDLSSIGLDKVGWNADYKNRHNTVLFSGDITRAPQGATESLYIKNGLDVPYLVMNNVYSGNEGAKFRIFVGKENAPNFGNNYTLDPNNVLLQVESVMDQKQKVLGVLIPQEKGVRFVLTDLNAGNLQVSGYSEITDMTREYLYHSYKDRISLRDVLYDAGCVFVDDEGEADIDLSYENLDKATILDLFKTAEVAQEV